MRTLAEAVRQTTDRALRDGALIPFEVAREDVAGGALPYRIEWASSLARKDQAAIPKPGTKPGAHNPFLPYEPALHVADVGDAHAVLLNKFPVALGHVVIVTRDYAEQDRLLDAGDLGALAAVLRELGGLAFFNGGADAGASIQHRHLQVAPFSAPLLDALLPELAIRETPQSFAALPFRHAVVRFAGASPSAATLQAAYAACLDRCALTARADGRLPPYNFLATRDAFVLVPRRRETWDDGDVRVSLNAMSFAGSIFVRDPALIPRIREAGLLRLLAAVTFAS